MEVALLCELKAKTNRLIYSSKIKRNIVLVLVLTNMMLVIVFNEVMLIVLTSHFDDCFDQSHVDNN